MKKSAFTKASLLLGALVIPAVANALTRPVRVTINHRPTDYRAIVINGTTYIAARDVAAISGRKVSYDSRRQIVNISSDNSPEASSHIDHADSEGLKGNFLTIPQLSLRVNSIVEAKLDGVGYLIANGHIKNTSNDTKNYSISDAKIYFKDGTHIPIALQRKELNKTVYARLEREESAKMQLMFISGVASEQVDKIEITVRAGLYADGDPYTFIVRF